MKKIHIYMCNVKDRQQAYQFSLKTITGVMEPVFYTMGHLHTFQRQEAYGALQDKEPTERSWSHYDGLFALIFVPKYLMKKILQQPKQHCFLLLREGQVISVEIMIIDMWSGVIVSQGENPTLSETANPCDISERYPSVEALSKDEIKQICTKIMSHDLSQIGLCERTYCYYALRDQRNTFTLVYLF